jgi:hypothetical protein
MKAELELARQRKAEAEAWSYDSLFTQDGAKASRKQGSDAEDSDGSFM